MTAVAEPDTDTFAGAPPRRPRTRRSIVPASADGRIALGLVLLLFGVYALCAGGHTYSSDEEGILLSTRRIFGDRTPVLVVNEDQNNLIPVAAGRDGQPVGVSGMAQITALAPLVEVGSFVGDLVEPRWRELTVRLFVSLANPAATAIGVALFFLVCVELGATRRRALLLALVYGLGTYAWPHAKTVFSEPITVTMLIGAVLGAVRLSVRSGYRNALLAGAFLGFAPTGRPSAAIFIPIVCAYVAVVAFARDRVRGVALAAVAVAAGAAPGIAFLLGTNWWRFGGPFEFGYQGLRFTHPIHEGVYGLLLSPGKSVFLYAPVVAVAIAAAFFAPRGRRRDVTLFLTLALVNVLFFARFIHWHGDHSWGPRYLLLSLPFFVLPAAVVLDRERWRRAVAVAGVLGVLSAMLGVAIYFNQFFLVAERELGSKSFDDGPAYWRSLHFDPEWSPIVGHVRLVDDVARNGIKGIAGDLPYKPLPSGARDRYFWYFDEPPAPDSWLYWHARLRAPAGLYALALVELAAAAAGFVLLRRTLRTDGGRTWASP
ncbi:MAG TPA: hypothetical protein VF230_06675 [Acidimicrobiales bacterium]